MASFMKIDGPLSNGNPPNRPVKNMPRVFSLDDDAK